MSITPSAGSVHLVIAGAGPAAQALVRRLTGNSTTSRQPGTTVFPGNITVLSNRDECPDALLELAALPQVSVRFGQAASFIDVQARTVTTTEGLEFTYDQLVIATGSAPMYPPVQGAARSLNYSTIDDAEPIGTAVKDITRVLGRRPLGILVGTGPAAGQAEAVLRARGVRPIRTTLRPAAVMPSVAGSVLPATGIVFEDGSSMNGDLVVLAEERLPRNGLAESAGLQTAPDGGIKVGRDFATSVPGIWAIGDAASRDGMRLGLVLSSNAAAAHCAARLEEDARLRTSSATQSPGSARSAAA
ncbi:MULTISPECIES: FAD-dependent oxidoreductase [Arthrobacter]|jgi:NAD(P)H-nitrite reductase large subunit|uniref:NAD(P)H-nitrite reductase large subunit n=1 Tax=Arthrobacter bambusae TaxID=1338426 RepID=A0AAW8DAD5_9MICC|nr:FAD-dependent oxidoreductase [Arthrobacter bambusae]MDP9905272.1 NAD(P)H-nitrite reductase large subunit [Arthrobacter bambusae]MDQ0129250.1 NAD(P)H-nitrite reductase large subunit [Arthrobacter bambusae]MDQ0180404.1 NAD(P)H-nitrite reductase large subunit [Arthrobacter bambusae]MDQ0238328.1 NAD(P)H-nitrite reductase large subunit [Arthrobacter bambusae]